MVSTCRWCTSVEPGASDLLPNYCSGSLSAEDEQAANDDLSFCLECVVEYHRARDEQPSLHERLWERETSRLLARFTQLSEEELEDDDLFLIQDDQEIQVPKFTAAQYENLLRVPIIEMLMYPYLMGHSKLSEMFVDALCKMENSNSLSIPDKYQGIYLLLVHPNETVRRWAIRAAIFLGKVDRDDFYDLQDIFISMFCVIELDIFHDCDIDTSYNPKESKIGLLPRHLYDSTNYKTYWLGLNMLLNVLDAQAMDSLLLGPDKQIDIMQCILNTMEKAVEDETMDPFWPALQCFMVILDCLGSKVWGQIEPASAFHAITGSPSYTAQIENIRRKAIMPKVKVEMSRDEDMVTCSQMVYESNVKEERKGSRFGRSANTESSSEMFAKMRSLVSVLQLDVGKAMRVHGSTFLWFFPYVESVMGLDDLSIVYIGEIIHYLCGEIKDLVNGRTQTCDKVTEFFTQILVFVIKLHLDKSCMNVLYYSMSNWVERDPVDMDVDSDDQMSPENSRWMDQNKEGQDRVVIPQMTSVGQKRHCTPQEDDKIFLKPGMSPVSCKKAKPSTTKIYAPSSRSATLVQEMEKTTKPPPPTAKHKFVRPALPVRKSVPQKESSLPSPMNHAAPVQIGASGSAPHVPSYKTYARPETPISNMARIDSGFKFDQSVLINTVLSWTFEMFCSFSQFGVPSDLCSLPLQEVKNSYKSYEEYFKTFYPLLLINTFEELAKDWEKSKHSRQITHQLKVIGPEYGSEIDSISFTACLSDRDVQHQLYPKEDDLVILWLPQNRNMYASNEPELMEPCAYFGCVSRSTLNLADERPTLNLTIQTRGNVSSVDNQSVKCQLVGSLVSAIRAFRALCMLKNNSMYRPILAPQVTFFQPSQENIIVMSLPEYNTEQLKAIKWGISIVRRQQRTPKICLIHGPPGTGKSKTIAGLLQSLFSEQNLAVPVGWNGKASRLRVLLCAPSNAAIDNLMKKVILIFKENCRDIQNPLGNCGDINLVRLGNEKTISKNLIPFSLDSQTRVRTQKAQQGHDTNNDRCKQQLDQQIDYLSKMCAMVKKDPDKFRQLTEHKSKLLKEREQLGRQLRAARSRKQETQAKVLQDAHIICSTLSTSGGMLLESAFRRLGHEPFNCIIVDEARQATEPETLIPLRFRCPSLILVGDPEQLPPTVVSQTAKEKKYDQSLMARLRRCLYRTTKDNPQIPLPVVFLNKQYRMHPDICLFPSLHIYNKALETDSATEQNRCAVSWPFQPYRLFDVADGCETKENESFCNLREVKLVLILIKMIFEKQVFKVGIITPYNAQKYRIQRAIEHEMQKEEGKRLQVEVDTVDGFQGREMDCIIVSCVRASSESGSIGFLGNRQRMNVTITRAKYSLFILGHLRTLREQRDWGALIEDAVRRGTIIQTREKDFKMDAKQIFKSGFRRSHSYPPREGAVAHPPKSSADTPALQGSGNPYPGPSSSAGERPVALGARQVPAPPQAGVASKGRSLAQPPLRPPSSGERPRDPRLAGGQREGQQSSHFSVNRSVSWDDTPMPQHVSRDGGRRESRQTLPCPSQTTRDARKRPSDGYSTSTSDKKVKQ
ncbi:hypothetical protein GJAV_G00040580 [Gymnothorax javanicus]|nr:hypothetical protein GJAV_G00040580 [Gymnothorax javanicus]